MSIINIYNSLSSIDGMLMTYLYCFSLNNAEKFKDYFSSKHLNLQFFLERENDGRLSFLDINTFNV